MRRIADMDEDQHCGRRQHAIDAARRFPLPMSARCAHTSPRLCRGTDSVWVGRAAGCRLGGVLYGVAPGHAVVPQRVARPQQVAGVAVQGRVGRCVCQQRQNGPAHALQRPRRRPRALQDVEANLARLWVERSGAKSGRSESWAAGHRRSRTSDTGRYLTFQWMLGWNTCRGAAAAHQACHSRAVSHSGRPPSSGARRGDKLHLRRRQRVLVRYVERKLEGAALIRRARRSLGDKRRGESVTSRTRRNTLAAARLQVRCPPVDVGVVWQQLDVHLARVALDLRCRDGGERVKGHHETPWAPLTSFSSLNSRVLLAMCGACARC